MGRDLSFWKTSTNTMNDNEEIYTALSGGEYLEHIAELPFRQIKHDFDTVFKGWGNDNSHYEKGSEAFQLMLSKQFVRIDCYSLTENNMNKIIDIMMKYDCPLYDSAINVRF
ncbi:MAG: hypothetical protein FWE14_13085 [Lachnospiraceae bacterium]|nr:hypothetical protein [Lachnospiraceae bacterium]